MSREILFRGLTGGEFVYGSYISQMLPSGKLYEAVQCEIDGAIREVVIAAGTVGQYTGLKDCNGFGLRKVFEGDIIDENGKIIGTIHEIQPRNTDLVIPRMGTKAWGLAYKEAVARGFDFAE